MSQAGLSSSSNTGQSPSPSTEAALTVSFNDWHNASVGEAVRLVLVTLADGSFVLPRSKVLVPGGEALTLWGEINEELGRFKLTTAFKGKSVLEVFLEHHSRSAIAH